MTEYYNNRLCVSVDYLVSNHLTTDQYKKLVFRKKTLRVARRGSRYTPALVEYDSLPLYIKTEYEQKHGNPHQSAVATVLENFIKDTPEAYDYYYNNYQTQTGEALKPNIAREYYTNAIVLNALRELKNTSSAKHKSLNNAESGMWQKLAVCIQKLDIDKYPHSLPTNYRRLKQKYEQYVAEGYTCLIHRGYGNSNSRKVNDSLESLFISIYCMENKPYSSWVCEYYYLFIAGKLDIVNEQTGELYNRQAYYNVDKGSYITISEATVWNYLHNPKNQAVISKMRSDNHRYLTNVRPHNHRHAPIYSLSKISMDDRDLPRKMHNGKRVKAYYAYDVASGVLLGSAHSQNKNESLFIECIRDMFRNIEALGLGMPMEVEVEHHIVKEFKDDLMKAGILFPFVRWCAPGNSQEKHAEQLNKLKKYGFEKRHQAGIGRFYAKREADVSGETRVYNDATQKYEMKAARNYSYEELVADDVQTIQDYNNGKHRTHKNVTCMEYLVNNVNPNLVEINKPLLVRYIGNKSTTSIVRSQYCQVQYNKYMLSTPEIIAKLAPNNYTVDAYYLPGDEIGEVYLYQNENFLDTAKRLVTYNTSTVEYTDIDAAARLIQDKYTSQWDTMVRGLTDNRVSPVQFISNDIEVKSIDVPIHTHAAIDDIEDDIEDEYSVEDYKLKAISDF